MQTMDISKTYILTNNLTGSDYAFGIVFNDTAPVMDSTARLISNDHWFLTQTKLASYYRMHILPKGRPFAFDVISSNGRNSGMLYMGTTNDQYPGQYWRFDKWANGGGYRLSNNFAGSDMHLDIRSDTLEPYLAAGDYLGQHWTPTPTTLSSGLIAGIVIGSVVALEVLL
ncbi:carbohydrate-binding module family 13 protein [Apodospora peruviana]|uniref:Carbohydrate-binding module family 13 protein n=1 Tax=Apodospora peruviana TaxID=516989 RepID=A0AAE0M8B8_9PEZI|nr:carbohydrate-binding module family 13 protein [Apodospora peruviana]